MTDGWKFHFCSVGLDPDEPDGPDLNVLKGLKTFLADDLSSTEREHFFNVTLPIIIKSALELKSLKPVNGLPFSLQQEGKKYNVPSKNYLTWIKMLVCKKMKSCLSE